MATRQDRPNHTHASHSADSATILRDGSTELSVPVWPARAQALHRAAGRTGGETEQRAQQAGLPPVAERALPPVLHGMRGLSFGAYPRRRFRAPPQPEARGQAEWQSRALRALGLGHGGAIRA